MKCFLCILSTILFVQSISGDLLSALNAPDDLLNADQANGNSFDVLADTLKVYDDLIFDITKIIGEFDGTNENAAQALSNINHAILPVFNGYIQVIRTLHPALSESIKKIDSALIDIEIALLQIVQSVVLATRSYPHSIKQGTDVTIGMSAQDNAFALGEMIIAILSVSNLVATVETPLALSEGILIATLESVMNLLQNILQFSTGILISIGGKVSPLQSLLLELLTAANTNITSNWLDTTATYEKFSERSTSILSDLNAGLLRIWSDTTNPIEGPLDNVADDLSSSSNALTIGLQNIGAGSDITLAETVNTFRLELFSLIYATDDTTNELEWMSNSVRAAAINLIVDVEAYIEYLTGLLPDTVTNNGEQVTKYINVILVSIATSLNTLILAISRRAINSLMNLIASENVLDILAERAAVLFNVTLNLQEVIGTVNIVLERILNAILSAENVTWVAEDTAGLTNILGALQNITGLAQSSALNPSVEALLETMHYAAGISEMVNQTLEAIPSIFEDSSKNNR